MSTTDKESAAAAQYGTGVAVNNTTGVASAPQMVAVQVQPGQSQQPMYVGYAPAAGGGAGQPMMAIPAGGQTMYAGPPPAYGAPGQIVVQQQQQPPPTIAQQITPNFGGSQQFYPSQQPVAGYQPQPMTMQYAPQPGMQYAAPQYAPQTGAGAPSYPPTGAGGPSYPPTGAGAQYPGMVQQPQQPMMARDGNPGAAAAAGYPGGVAVQAGPNTTVIYAQAPAPIMFGTAPQQITCAQCRYQGVSMVTYKAGNGTYLVCCGLACVGCWLGCCLIPFCVPELQDAYHQCPNCKCVLGKRALMG